ncbi:MAG: tRNA (guanosine(37)-N1)-methyltransferase TrmD [Spirochaetales bacterium]|nr:tRNA (guanosine(37)-N1)-methyltransferase TrmD [Spirochaetales bacterium]
MKFTLVSLFPEIVEGFFSASIIAKSVQKGLVEYQGVQVRDFAFDKHRTCDDYPYGGGAGMVLKPEPLAAALDSVEAKGKRVVVLSPAGRLFDQSYAADLARAEELVLVCGRYEGIDQRILDTYATDEVSIGDYVVSSGEVAALVIVDAVYRLVEGVINRESLEEESHTDGLLEYPHYTRPENYLDKNVPDVLLSGNHRFIRQWRRAKQLQKTRINRPDLFARYTMTDEEKKWLKELEEQGE